MSPNLIADISESNNEQLRIWNNASITYGPAEFRNEYNGPGWILEPNHQKSEEMPTHCHYFHYGDMKSQDTEGR